MKEQKTQIAVIGAGPGGYAAAFLAADLGMEVCLIDKHPNPGGVCLYEGCIPSKAYLHVANLLQHTREARKMGVDFSEPKIDLDKIRQWKQNVVTKLTGGLGQLCQSRKIQYLRGSASFLGPNSISFCSSTDKKISEITFIHSILACGSVPQVPPFLSSLFPPRREKSSVADHSLEASEQPPLLMNSTQALQLKTIPKKLLILGGGYIGLEMGTVYSNLGSEVSVVEMEKQILPGTDKDLIKPLAIKLEGLFSKIHLNTQLIEAHIEGNAVCVKLQKKGQDEIEDHRFDSMLISVGRRPNLEGIGLENTKVQMTPEGFIQVDKKRQTAEASIYAIGDITGQPMLAHKASHEGKVAVEAIYGHQGAAFMPQAIPAVIFTNPEIAYCGIMEEEAKARGQAIQVARFPWVASGRALSLSATDGLTKMIIDEKSGRLLGMGIVGSGAGELIAEGVLAIEMGALAKDIALSIHPHPTLSETLMECSEIFSGQCTHIHRAI